MNKDDYYNRRTEADFIEEEMGRMRGCRSMIIIMLVLLVMAIAAAVWLH